MTVGTFVILGTVVMTRLRVVITTYTSPPTAGGTGGGGGSEFDTPGDNLDF
jgi:hypothetical protein